ncbi:Na+/H+ antiporter NhaC [Halanaerobium saccharolyticum subsp. saccharolyticum DSM 6643]|uniref:Na+/H+ antiporter NhaC n=1 Tax=Halanaerobium saccharolyticum subsp. saccharolyticum DSM 6643 TaxID=1293054 RepID=M5DZI1_9FIRM|nr:Na+/H+ antiporter NhaC [Halanaerobium saccharolyticum]CCU78609.1 Na+/H+ antiporter NhaC [Halanaerobium saccharolyticum subsp. saccharolyticum DSM 6643]
MSNEDKSKQISFAAALIPVFVLLTAGALSVFIWKVGMLIPLLSGTAAAAFVGAYYGKSWNELENGLKKGVSQALQPVFILIIVGSIIGTWILSGIIPSLIYYGLKIINPSIFLPLAALITAVVSTSTGTSFTSIATVGIALMAVGNGMGFPAAISAAAVISGAFFGDKISPLSDTTNIAPAIAECDLFEHIEHMFWDTIPAFLISLVLYYFLGINQMASNSSGINEINSLINGLETIFNISPVLLLVPVLTIILAVKKIPAIPALISVSFIGGLFALVFQGSTIKEVFSAFSFGYRGSTGQQMLDSLLNRGGISSMGGTIILLIIATALGGIMREVGILDAILNKFISLIKNEKQLGLTAIISTFLIGFSTGAQILAIIIPASLFKESYNKFGLHTKNLSRTVEAAGTVGITLVPWSVPAIFAANMLGAEATAFIPYLFFPILVILINIIYSITGFSIARADKKTDADLERSTMIG